MIMVLAIYRIPSIKHLILVISHSSSWNDSSKLSDRNAQRIGDLENLLFEKHELPPEKRSLWKVKLIHIDDFLQSLENLLLRVLGATHKPLPDSENMELLAINLVKNPLTLREGLELASQKVLSNVNDEDEIQVFI